MTFEEAVQAAHRAGQAVWPRVSLDLQAFTRWAEAAGVGVDALGNRGEEMFLVAGCVAQHPEALEAFEKSFLATMTSNVGRVVLSRDQADELAEVARPLAALVNLLPLHPGGAPDLAPSPPAQMLAFARRLRSRGVEAVLRKSRGLDISAACGQLRVELEAPRRGGGGKVRPQEHAGVE